jgi:hypothetical protein
MGTLRDCGDIQLTGNCSFCGNEPVRAAYCVGSDFVRVCFHCATRQVPCLQAQAIVRAHGAGPEIISALDYAWAEARGNYWREACCAVAQAGSGRESTQSPMLSSNGDIPF